MASLKGMHFGYVILSVNVHIFLPCILKRPVNAFESNCKTHAKLCTAHRPKSLPNCT